jgi:2-(1,2-epoxy-1,2-dihydrophenyl)acetyl-CoA isomerase
MTQVRITSPAEFVGQVELDRPPFNFLNNEVLRELGDALLQVDDDPRIRAVVLCSAGRHFCAGADLVNERPAAEHEPMAFYRLAARLFATRKPMVAAVQGRAVGGGAGLALAADFRVAARSAVFAVNFTRIGFHPGFALTETLGQVVGQQAARYILMSGRDVGADDAARLGLADRLAADDELRDQAVVLAAELAAAAPLSTMAVRATLRHGLMDRIMAAMMLESGEQLRLRTTSDFTEGVTAAREKREPRFTGE